MIAPSQCTRIEQEYFDHQGVGFNDKARRFGCLQRFCRLPSLIRQVYACLKVRAFRHGEEQIDSTSMDRISVCMYRRYLSMY